MELRQLQYFITVAEELHFGRAAKRLNMTQPPLSQQIQQLEEELGIILFRRTKRVVELTDAGKFFLEGVNGSLEQLDEAIESARRAARGEIGTLTIGFVGSATYDLLPPLIRTYRNQYPNVEVKLRELATPQQLEELYHRKLDIGFLRPPIESDILTTEVVHETPCILALSIHHPLAQEEHITLAQLQNDPFILVSRNVWQGFYDDIVFMCHRAGYSPNIKQEATEYHTVIGLVAAGVGIAIVPAALQNFALKEVVYHNIEDMTNTVKMAIAYEKERMSKETENFIKVMKEIK